MAVVTNVLVGDDVVWFPAASALQVIAAIRAPFEGAGAVAIVPMDYVYWSPGLAQLVSNTGAQGQIWITGSASQLATDSLAGRGWKIVPKAGARLDK